MSGRHRKIEIQLRVFGAFFQKGLKAIGRFLLQYVARSILRTVIDHDDLFFYVYRPTIVAAKPDRNIEINTFDTMYDLTQGRRLIVNRDDNGDFQDFAYLPTSA